MILLTLFDVFKIIFFGSLFLFICGIIIRIVSVNRFRKKCKADDIAKFYDDEEKLTGKIVMRTGDRCYIEYLDQKNSICHRYFHVSQIYPAW